MTKSDLKDIQHTFTLVVFNTSLFEILLKILLRALDDGDDFEK